MKKDKKRKREKGILLPDDSFSIVKNSQKVYLDKQGKIKQDINYTLIPEKEKQTNWVKVVILTFILAAFFVGGFIFMSFAYKYDIWISIFEFADNYLFLGAITLFVFLVFKSKK